jgi:hypothetical protein
VSVHLGKKSLHSGEKQTIIIIFADKPSSNSIAGASVLGRITSQSSDQFKKLEGSTDNEGMASYPWKVSNEYTTGK